MLGNTQAVLTGLLRESGGAAWPPWADQHGTPNTSFAISSLFADFDITYTGDKLRLARGGTIVTIVFNLDGTSLATVNFTSTASLACLDWDGTNLNALNTSTGVVYTLDGITDSVLSSFDLDNFGAFYVYTTADSGRFILTGHLGTYNNRLLVFDHATQTIIEDWPTPGIANGTTQRGCAYLGDDIIATTDSFDEKIWFMNISTGVVTGSIAAPASDVTGVTWTGTNLITTDRTTDLCYIHDGLNAFVP